MSVLSMMNSTCTITHKTPLQNATTGEYTPRWGTGDTPSIRCSVQALSASESEYAARETGESVYAVFFPSGTSVVTTDRLKSFAYVNGGTHPLASATLEVSSPPVDHAGRGAYLYCEARRVNGGGHT